MGYPTIALEVPETYRALTVSSGVRASALNRPAKIALRDGPRAWTYGELIGRIDRLAHAAGDALGLAPGDHVGVLAPNCAEYLEAVLAFSDARMPAITLSARLNAAELAAICDDARVRVLLVHPSCEATARAASLATVERIIVLGDEYEALLAGASDAPYRSEAGEWDIFSIPFTSGTTGRPKGVMLPHRARALLFYAMAVEYGCFGPEDSFLALAPCSHGAGLAFAMLPIFFGGTCELIDGFDPAHVLTRLKDARHTGVFMVPTHLHAIFALSEDVLAAHRDLALKSLIVNAAPLPQRAKERVIAQWGDGLLHETYGSTEVGIASNNRPLDQVRKESCVGLPFPNCQIRLLDDDGAEVGPDEVGELYTNSPFIMAGYWQDGAAHPAPLRDGWFSAGDLAKKDDEGYLYIVDRKTDMVISGGMNIYPRQIEEVLFRHPAVGEAAVVGVADERWGERLRAFIVPRGDAPLDADEIIAFCARELSSYKVPRDIVIIEALPKNAAGKILKRDLRDNPPRGRQP